MTLALIQINTVKEALIKTTVSYETGMGTTLKAGLICRTCSESMGFYADRFECPNCEYLLELEDALHVISYASTMLNTLNTELKNRTRTQWGWVTWLQRLLVRKVV